MTCLKKKDQLYFKRKNGAIGQVTIGSRENPICIPSNSALTVPGQTSKIPSKLTCLVEQAQHHNLPPGIVINRCLATTKARSVPCHSCQHHQTEMFGSSNPCWLQNCLAPIRSKKSSTGLTWREREIRSTYLSHLWHPTP